MNSSGDYKGVVIYGGGQRPQINRLLAMFVALLAVTGLGAGTQVVFDVMEWRELTAPRLARAACDDPSSSQARQADAIVVMLRDAVESIEAMKRAEARGGKSAVQAAGAMTRLRELLESR